MSVVSIQTALARKPWTTCTAITATPVHQVPPTIAVRPETVSKDSISWLWIQLSEIYGQLFITKFGAHDANGTWLAALNGLTPKALESGIARLRDLANEGQFCQYPPNSLEFKALCLAFYNDLQLPTVGKAFREVQNSAYGTRHHWSHEVVQFTASRLSSDFLKMEYEAEAYKVFKPVYEQVCHLIKQGHPIPPVLNKPVMLPSGPQNASVAHHHLSVMKQRLGA